LLKDRVLLAGSFLEPGFSHQIYVPALSRRQARGCILHIPARFKGELTCALHWYMKRARTHVHTVYGQTGVCVSVPAQRIGAIAPI